MTSPSPTYNDPDPHLPKRSLLVHALFVALVLLALAAVSQLGAADEYWRTDGATGGTWTSSSWNIGSATATGGTGWTSGNNAVFTANSTLTFATSTVGNVSVTNGSTVTIATGGTLTLASPSIFDIGTGSILTWQAQSVVASSAGGITKSGAGTLDLGPLTWATSMNGGFTLNNGTVIVTGNKALGNGSLTFNGGTLQSSSSKTFTPTSITIGGDFALAGTGDDNYDAATTIALGASTRTITNSTASGSRQFRGLISGAVGAGLTFSGAGAGQIYIGNTGNTFTGPLVINGGEVVFNGDGAFGATTSITLDGGRLTLASMNTGGTVAALNAASIANTRNIFVGATAGTSLSVQGSTGVTTYNGIIADKAGSVGVLVKQGSGKLVLGGVSTYSGGTAINNGTVQLTTGNDRLPSGTVVSLGQGASANVGNLDLNGMNQTIAGLTSVTGINATVSKNTVTSTSAATLTINTAASSYAYGDGTTTNSGVITGAISLVKLGSGTQSLGDINTYTGATNIQEGTLQLTNGSDRLPTGTTITLGSASTSGILKLNGNSQIVAALGTSGSGTANAVVNGSATSATITVNNTSSQSFSGKLGGTGTNENNIALNKTGAGMLTLSGANTYSGGTTVGAGTLQAMNNTALGAGAVSVVGGNLRADAGVTIANNITVAGSGTIASDSFENTLTLFTGSGTGNSFKSGNTGASTTLPNSPYAVDGTYALAVIGGTYAITSSAINTAGYSNVALSFRLAALSSSGSTDGLDGSDTVTLQVSPDGGATYYTQALVAGNSNAVWAYSTGTGTVNGTYAAANASTTQTGGSGNRTTDGYSTINISSLPSIANLLVKITATDSVGNVSETWAIDNFKITGTAAGNATIGGDNTSGTATYTGNVTLNNAVTLTAASGGTVAFSGKLSGAVGNDVTKSGSGTVTLSNGANDYAGTTTVTDGTLQVGVSGTGKTGTGNVTVNGAAAVLAGTGTVQGNTSVLLGQIKPGDSAGTSVGQLDFQGSLNLTPSGTGTVTTLQIAGVSGVGLGWDKINVKPTGTLTLSSLGNIFVDGTGYTAAVGDTFDLLDWTTLVNNGFSAGTNNRTGGLGGGNLDLPTLTGGLTWNVNNFLTTGAISVTAVPEPSRVILLFLGIGSLLLRRRRA